VSRSPPTALFASLAVHACLFALMLFLKGPRFPEAADRRVVVEFDAAPPPLAQPLRAERPPAGRQVLPPVALADSLRLQGPQRLSLPAGSAGPAPATRAATRQQTPLPPRPEVPPGPAAVSLPSPREALALQRPVAPAAPPAPAASAPSAPAPDAGGATVERGFLQTPALEWKGRARTLRSSGSPVFPEVLLREGRDVDVEAVFTVAATGQVVDVEIVRSSGYAAVDREVEKTILSYLFEPTREGGEDTGRVQFGFRLERER